MFKTIGVIFAAIRQFITALAGMTQSIENVVSSCNHATAALDKSAAQLEADVEFECMQKADRRAKDLNAYRAELEELMN